MLQIQRKKDERTPRACTHALADIPNGVTVSAKDLAAGKVLQGGAVIGRDTAGLYHVIKTAKVTADVAANGTTVEVAKGHHFKAGDIVMADKGNKAVAIASISSGDTDDTITLPTGGLGVAVEKDAAIVQGKAAADAGAFPYDPVAVVADSYDVESLGNHLVAAVTIGQFKAALAPATSDKLKAALPTIVFI